MYNVGNIILVWFFLQAVTGCSGYEVVQSDHVFLKENVSKLKVPLFINRTIFSNISKDFTNELIKRLSNFKNLDVDGGEPNSVGEDVLIGILTSSNLEKDVISPIIRSFTGNSTSLRDSIGARPDFFITSQYRVGLSLEIVLIKNPLIYGVKKQGEPKIVFHHSIPVSFKVVNNISGYNGPDSLGAMNYTNNRGFFEFEVKRTAKRTAELLENLIEL